MLDINVDSDFVIKTLGAMIRINSILPFEKQLAEYIANELKGMGLEPPPPSHKPYQFDPKAPIFTLFNEFYREVIGVSPHFAHDRGTIAIFCMKSHPQKRSCD